jgi:hypothetical protein
MAKSFPVITGHEKVDLSLEDLGRSAFKLAKEFRGVSQVAKTLILFDVLHHGEHCPSTVAKKGHNNLIRLMLVARDELVLLQKLRDQILDDPVATIKDKLDASKAVQKGIADLTKTSLDVEKAAEAAADKSSDFLLKLADHTQRYDMHREKLGADIDNATDAELLSISTEVL